MARGVPIPNMKQSLPGRVRAFTLIELLVVVAVIGILASLLLPALAGARVKAQRVKCMSNLRQIGLALHNYADDHEGWFPETTHSGPTNQSWIFTLSPYLEQVNRIRACPADPLAERRIANDGTSYTLNEYISVDRLNPFGEVIETFRHRDTLSNASSTITVFIGAESLSPNVTSDHTHSRNWVRRGAGNWGGVIADIEPDRFRRGSTPDHTGGTANYLFADGHVETIPASEFKRRIDAGENPALPPP